MNKKRIINQPTPVNPTAGPPLSYVCECEKKKMDELEDHWRREGGAAGSERRNLCCSNISCGNNGGSLGRPAPMCMAVITDSSTGKQYIAPLCSYCCDNKNAIIFDKGSVIIEIP